MRRDVQSENLVQSYISFVSFILIMADFNAMFGDSDDEDFYGFEPDNLSDSEGEEDDDEIELEDLAELVSGRQPQFTWTEELSPVDVPAFTQNVGPIDMPTNSTSPLSFF